jgi:PAS domain S-box-containing protein
MSDHNHLNNEMLKDILDALKHPEKSFDKLEEKYRNNEETAILLNQIKNTLKSDYRSTKQLEKFSANVYKTLFQFAHNKYNRELQLTGDNLFDTIVTSVNFLGQELNYSTVTTTYLNDIFNSLGDVVIVVDNEGVILYVNKAALKMLNFPESKLRKSNISKLLEKKEDFNSLLETSKNHQPVNFVTSDKKKIPFSLKISKFSRPDNPLMGHVIIARDLLALMKQQQAFVDKNIELLRANNELEEMHKSLLNILDSIESLVLVSDANTFKVSFVNEFGRKQYGSFKNKKI